MKLILIILFFANIFTFQAQIKKELKKINIYLVEWDANYRTPRRIENIKKMSHYNFETNFIEFENLFSDFDDMHKYLLSCPQDSLNYSVGVNALVEFCFKNKKTVQLYFVNNGSYYYNEKWYLLNEELYFKLFNYFSNVLIPEVTLKKCSNH